MKILLWGKGRDFNALQLSAKWKKNIEITGIVLSDINNVGRTVKVFDDGTEYPIIHCSELPQIDFNYIVIANNFFKDIIAKNFKEHYFDFAKMIIPYGCEAQSKEQAVKAMSELVENPEEVVIKLTGIHNPLFLVPMTYDMMDTSVVFEPDKFLEMADYTRIRTTELLIKELKRNNIFGAMAEVGVFRGRFAKIFSHYFPEKDLYLYDTFEGFAARQIEDELEHGYVTREWAARFADTSVNDVKEYIGNPVHTKIRKGFFPETVMEEEKKRSFCLVSLDADLYEPILEGLRFFYPRLTEGGYILVHDYNGLDISENQYVTTEGVKQAVYDYEKEIGKLLHKVPISDLNGSIIITK